MKKNQNTIVMHINIDLSFSLISVSLEAPSKHSGEQFNPIIFFNQYFMCICIHDSYITFFNTFDSKINLIPLTLKY